MQPSERIVVRPWLSQMSLFGLTSRSRKAGAAQHRFAILRARPRSSDYALCLRRSIFASTPEIDPRVKILLISGYSNHELVIEAQKRFPLWRKPFLSEDLIRKFRFMLGPDDPTAD
jgi:hypothetical protein